MNGVGSKASGDSSGSGAGPRGPTGGGAGGKYGASSSAARAPSSTSIPSAVAAMSTGATSFEGVRLARRVADAGAQGSFRWEAKDSTCVVNVGWNFVKVSGLGVVRAQDLATHSFCRSQAVVRCSLVARHDGSETVFALEFEDAAQAQAAEVAIAAACDGVDVFGPDTEFTQEEVAAVMMAPHFQDVVLKVQAILHLSSSLQD